MTELSGNASDFLKVAVAAAGRGDLKTVRSTLKRKPDWHRKVGSHGRTMLWEASHRGKLEVVKYLVGRGADLDACGSYYTPYFVEVNCLCIATYKKHIAVADCLEKAGAKSNIHMAAFLGQLDLVKKFLSRSRKRLNMGHKQHVMAGSNEEGIECVPRSAPWATPLCYALRGGDFGTAKFLVQEGAIVRDFSEPLFIAAADNVEMVRLLLENGAAKQYAPRVCPDGSDLYKLVSSYGIELSKAELNAEFVYLCRGDRGGNPASVRQMLQHGADVNHQDAKGKTALHRAAKAGFVETVKVLLEHDASVCLRDNAGETAIFDAARSTIKKTESTVAAVKLLLEAGADPNAQNKKGIVPAAIAKKPAIKKLLQR